MPWGVSKGIRSLWYMCMGQWKPEASLLGVCTLGKRRKIALRRNGAGRLVALWRAIPVSLREASRHHPLSAICASTHSFLSTVPHAVTRVL